ncbi:HDOD domain-containing protein [Maridesulfovibrio sp. FT414]|uniref:HDOD domain-containing protein n=1 Tax=Maridesulfovibrio sp. FT414 TaxID=2979469 RepID=UPI003D8098EF
MKVRDFLETKVILPALPQIQARLQQVLDDPEAGEAELVEIIRQDPKLVASVLRLANKRLLASGEKVDTAAKAVKVLGFKDAGGLALGTASISLFRRSKYAVLSVEKFWKHSIACAVIASRIANAMDFSDPERFFAGGLVHDIGLFLIFESNHGLALELVDLADRKGESFYHAEYDLLGFNHAMLGGIVLKDWDFPRHLIAAAAGHHNPSKVKSDPDAMVTHLACFMSRAMGYNHGLSSVLGFIDHDAWAKTGIAGAQFEEMLPEIQGQIDDLFKILNPADAAN